MRKLLWIGDAAVASGFARATHKTLDVLRRTWDVVVLGLNYRGDPHNYPYPIYPCWPGGDLYGLGRIKELVDKEKPELIVIQNDPWNILEYTKLVANIPIVASMPVDGKNCRFGRSLNSLSHAIFWTHFGAQEAVLGGYTGTYSVIPLGVDLEIYQPQNKAEARRKLGLTNMGVPETAFIFGNVNRNQPRKRLDLTVSYFCDWLKESGAEDAYLYLHVAPTGEEEYDVAQLFRYFSGGNKKRLILVVPEVGQGVEEEALACAYSAFDAQISTTQGEGWGLTTLEGMACGIPQIVPGWSALGEWSLPASVQVLCSEIAVTPNKINVVGGIPDRKAFIDAMITVYRDHKLQQRLRNYGLNLVHRPEFRWESIGLRFAEALEKVVSGGYFPIADIVPGYKTSPIDKVEA